MLKPKRKVLLTILILWLLVVPKATFAIALVVCGNDDQSPCTIDDFLIGMARIINWLISIAGLYAIYQIIGAGFWMTTTMGDEEAIKKHKSTISNAIVGMVLVMAAYLFVATAVNGILAQGVDCKKINLTDPLSYIVAQDTCKK